MRNTGLALQWDLDENLGTSTADASGKGHPGSLTGSATWTAGNKDSADKAVLPGADGGVVASGPALRTDRSFTVSAWVKLDSANQQVQAAVSQDGNHCGVFLLGYSDLDRWVFSIYSADADSPTTVYAGIDAKPQIGVWTHVTGVYDAAAKKIHLYVNGVASGSSDVSPLWDATGPLRVGQILFNGNPAASFHGAIDDVRMYSGALSPADVSRLAQGEL